MKENALQCSAETPVTDEVLQAEHQYGSWQPVITVAGAVTGLRCRV